MALELLKADYGNTEDDNDEEIESTLSAAEEQGESLPLIVYEKELAQEGVQEAQMINEWVGGSIMPDELDFQRDLEYQTETENLQLQPCYDYEEPICIQAAPPYLELWEMNRGSPSVTDSCSQGEILDLNHLMVSDRELPNDEACAEMAITQMINASVRGNIMPVELAIQRELAYKKKIESLKLRPHYGVEKPPIVFQGAPSNLELEEINRKSTSDNVSRSKGEMPDLMFFERKLAPDKVQEAVSQMTNERVTRKIMSVELAIKRELEYQAKIKNLQRRPRNEFEEAPISIQGAPSDLELEKMNRKSHSDNISVLQGRISDPMFIKKGLDGERSQGEITRSEITGEKLGMNIMPVELAIQRELSFQRKFESSQSQSSITSQEPRIPFQGSSSNQRTVEMKRKAPSGNLTFLPRKAQQSYSMRIPETRFVNTFCKVCQLDCTSPFNLKQHYKGKVHRARVKLLAQKRNGNQVKGVVCYVCLITCTDEDSLQRHLAGKKHAACVEAKAVKNSQQRT